MDHTTEELIQSITAYESQLKDLENSGMEETEMEALKSDLEEIIEMSKEQLLDLKKSQLLAQLDDECLEPTTSQQQECDFLESIQESLTGLQCRIRYSPSGFEHVKFHNCVILDVIPPQDVTSELDRLKVKILFCAPLNEAMKPCSYFMDGKCNFGEDKCKFSHGFEVIFSDLFEYQPPDFSKLSSGDRCLFMTSSTGLYESGVIEDVCEQERKVVLKSDRTLKDEVLPLEAILPLQDADIEEDLAEGRQNNQEKNILGFSENCSDEIWNNGGPVNMGDLGSWEQHTKGIGSRLLVKMGYIAGAGLGKSSQGMIQPVGASARVLPKGQSLDKAMEDRLEGDKIDPLRKVKKAAKKQERANAANYKRACEERKKCVFEFLNTKLGVRKKDKSDDFHRRDGFGVDSMRKEDGQRGSGGGGDKDVNIKAFKIDEDLKICQKSIERLKEAMKRNEGKDSVVYAQLKQKLQSSESRLGDLKREGDRLRGVQENRSSLKKMAVF